MIASLGIQPGITVADLGTGTGVWLPYLVEAVGPAGLAIAEDIARLPQGRIDLAFVFEVYHHLDYQKAGTGKGMRSLC